MTKNVDGRLHQLLHGYDRGHRKLAGSVDLPVDASALVDIYSDLSGSSRIEGFESYLTVYPVTHTGFVAFARTWLATEMPRAGCVWTHTLLVPHDIVSSLPHLGVLNQLFLRPNHNLFAEYEKPLLVPPLSSERLAEWPPTVARQLLVALYWNADRSTFLAADSAEKYEALALDLWSQQWGTLRRSFRFCTGSIEDRNTSSRFPRFDLQIIPRNVFRHQSIESNDGIGIDDQDQDTWLTPDLSSNWWERDDARWINTAMADLASGFRTPLRQWLAAFGSEARKPRTAFAPLVDLFIAVNSRNRGKRNNVQQALDTTAKWYPFPHYAKRLKRTLFSGIMGDWLSPLTVDEVDLLPQIALSPSAACLDPVDLRIEVRAGQLGKSEDVRLLDFIDRVADTEAAQAFLHGLIFSAPLDDLVVVIRDHPAFLSAVLDRRLEIAIEPAVWATSPHLIPDLTIQVLAENLPQARLDVLSRIAWETGNKESVVLLADAFEDARNTLFSLLDESPGSPEGLLTVSAFIESHSDELFDWIRSRPNSSVNLLRVGALILRPASIGIQGREVRTWLPLAYELRRSRANSEAARMMSFLFSVSLIYDQMESAELAELVYPSLFAAAEDRALSLGEWAMISDARRAIRYPFDSSPNPKFLLRLYLWAAVTRSWSPIHLLKAVSDPHQFKAAVSILYEELDAANYVDWMAAEIENHPGFASSEQTKTIRKWE